MTYNEMLLQNLKLQLKTAVSSFAAVNLMNRISRLEKIIKIESMKDI